MWIRDKAVAAIPSGQAKAVPGNGRFVKSACASNPWACAERYFQAANFYLQQSPQVSGRKGSSRRTDGWTHHPRTMPAQHRPCCDGFGAGRPGEYPGLATALPACRPLITNYVAFRKAVTEAATHAGKFVCFGVKPSRSETGFGYIAAGNPPEEAASCRAVERFIENPDIAPLRLIEGQTGSYLTEDDIVRLDDNYGRLEGETPKSG